MVCILNRIIGIGKPTTNQKERNTLVSVKYLDYVLNRECKHCKTLKAPSTHHCSTCLHCIARMDHHCPWVNNCVGIYNQKFFF